MQSLPTSEQLADDRGASLALYQCDQCSLVQLGEEPIIYGESETSATSFSPSMIDHRKGQAERFVEYFNLKDKKVLEVGCGDGHFLSLLSELGAKPFGIEPSKKAVQKCHEQGLSVEQGEVSGSSQLKDSPFEAFATIHVLEHVPDPNSFLQGIYNNLAKGAGGFIEVPSLEKILEGKRFYDLVLDHLSYFTLGTLRFILEKNNFKVLDIRPDWEGEHIIAFVKKQEPGSIAPEKPREGLGSLSDWVRPLTKRINEFVQDNLSQNKRVALWGAGNEGISLLAVTGVKGIAYVVDSASYKQGRFTPVSHLPVVPPSALQTDPVSALIIAAPRYYHEIVKQVKQDIKFKGTVALLEGNHLKEV
ncbi:MAG: class I SAM-dependent methyltransferase [archaeon]